MKLFLGNRTSFLKPFLNNDSDNFVVVTNIDSRLDKFASVARIETLYYDDKISLINILKELKPASVYSAGCPYIIPIGLPEFSQTVFINVHPSLLPFYPGIHSITEALYQEGPYGVTVHTMGETVDSGRLIAQSEIFISDDLSVKEIYKLYFNKEEQLIEETLISNKLDIQNISKMLLKEITPLKSTFKRDRKFREISPLMSIHEISKRVKILNVSNQFAFIKHQKKIYYILEALNESESFPREDLFKLSAIDGTLYLRFIQIESNPEDSVIN